CQSARPRGPWVACAMLCGASVLTLVGCAGRSRETTPLGRRALCPKCPGLATSAAKSGSAASGAVDAEAVGLDQRPARPQVLLDQRRVPEEAVGHQAQLAALVQVPRGLAQQVFAGLV